MSNCSAVPIALPQWDGGSRKIRFIYLVNLTSFRLKKCPNQGPVIPLYLGADVLSNTDIRIENHPRYHAKFAKRGLATKINFSSAFRFQGLKVSAANNSLWFYNVQGLFRVAFEMYSKQEQLAVLDNFHDIWKSQINDDPLNTTYSLSVQLDFPSVSDTKSISESSQNCKADGEMMDTCVNEAADTSADHDYCLFSKQSLPTEKSQLIVSRVREKLNRLDDQLSSQPQRCMERQDTILMLLESIGQYIDGNLKEKDVAETVLALLKAEDWVKDSVYTSYLLTCMGRWLGQKFYEANSSISQTVEDFKFQHIERISDLPPAEELATELFPEAMQELLLNWMGLCEESSLEKRRSEYPILLLILEFANHNLVTGVAHVLYSSLICK